MCIEVVSNTASLFNIRHSHAVLHERWRRWQPRWIAQGTSQTGRCIDTQWSKNTPTQTIRFWHVFTRICAISCKKVLNADTRKASWRCVFWWRPRVHTHIGVSSQSPTQSVSIRMPIDNQPVLMLGNDLPISHSTDFQLLSSEAVFWHTVHI